MRDISDNLMWIFENWFNDQYSQAWPEITINELHSQIKPKIDEKIYVIVTKQHKKMVTQWNLIT